MVLILQDFLNSGQQEHVYRDRRRTRVSLRSVSIRMRIKGCRCNKVLPCWVLAVLASLSEPSSLHLPSLAKAIAKIMQMQELDHSCTDVGSVWLWGGSSFDRLALLL